mgnify:FL=1
MKNFKSLSGSEKLAILVMSIGLDAAKEALKGLKPKEISKIIVDVSRLGKIPKEVVAQVLDEYYKLMNTSNETVKGGSEQAQKMIVSLGEDHNTDQINTLIKKDTALSIFDEFQQTKVASISDFLKNEHPQVIALIFSQLKSDKAAQLLSTFEKEKQADIMNRLVVMNEISPDVIVEISEVIQENFGFMNIEGEETLSGTSMVAQILNNTDQDVEENILGSISKYDEDLSTQVRDQMFLFTDILNIDKDAMQAINLEIDKADLAKALKGQAIELADKFFNNMSGRAAEMIKEDMENLGPLKAADVKEAQQNIIRKIRDLEAKGEIVLNSDEEDFIE